MTTCEKKLEQLLDAVDDVIFVPTSINPGEHGYTGKEIMMGRLPALVEVFLRLTTKPSILSNVNEQSTSMEGLG